MTRDSRESKNQIASFQGPKPQNLAIPNVLKCRKTNLAQCLERSSRPTNYICDFVCHERLIVIEVDGGQHNESVQDSIRDRFLVAEGYKVLRFWNNDVLGNIDGVLTVIQIELLTQRPLTPTLSPQERGEGEK